MSPWIQIRRLGNIYISTSMDNLELNERWDSPRALACLRVERRGDCVTAFPAAATFSGVQTWLVLPDDFRFKHKLVSLKTATHKDIPFLLGICPCLLISKWLRYNLCVWIKESAFFKISFNNEVTMFTSPRHTFNWNSVTREI